MCNDSVRGNMTPSFSRLQSINRLRIFCVFNVSLFVNVYCMSLIFINTNIYAVINPYDAKNNHSDLEDNTPILSSQIRFWENIFLKYDQLSVLVHDLDYPDIIIDVIDLKKMARKYHIVGPMELRKQKKITDNLLSQYKKAIQKFKKYGKKAENMGPFERRLYLIYGNKSEEFKNRLLAGQVQLRTQVGLFDSIKLAAARATNYLETMEKIFREENMPQILTRIAFVESMFNTKAKSKVGAFGMWQFMKLTGRRFLTIKSFIDERGSPFKATRAAARLLKENFIALGTWPLAITAYNHGVNGLRRAKNAVGTSSLEDIIQRYKSSSFGFASKNFYAEFVAVAKVYEYLTQENKVPKIDRSQEIIPVRLTKAMSLSTLMNAISADVDTVMRYNGCINEKYLRRNKNLILPANYVLYFPRRLAITLMNEIEALEGPKYASNKSL